MEIKILSSIPKTEADGTKAVFTMRMQKHYYLVIILMYI